MKNKIYLLLIIFSKMIFSQEIDTIEGNSEIDNFIREQENIIDSDEYIDLRSSIFFRVSTGYSSYTSTLNSYIEKVNNKIKIPYSISFGYDFFINDSKSIVFEPSFFKSGSDISRKIKEYPIDRDENSTFNGVANIEIENYSLEVPIYLRSHINQKFNIIVGINNSFIFPSSNNKITLTTNGGNIYGDYKESEDYNYNKYNLGILGGMEMRIYDNLFIDTRVEVGVLKLIKKEDRSKILNGSILGFNNFRFLLGFSYKIPFGKENKKYIDLEPKPEDKYNEGVELF